MFPPFLSSLRTRGVRMPSFLFSLGRRTWSPFSSKKFFVLLAQVSSAAILFAEHFFFFFTEKNFLTKKNFFLRIFFPEVGKPSTEISKRKKKLRISAKMRKIGSTDYYYCYYYYTNYYYYYYYCCYNTNY